MATLPAMNDPELQALLDEAAASMPLPTRAIDTSDPTWDYKVSFCFRTDGVGIPHPQFPSAAPVTRTDATASRHPHSPPLADSIARAADRHRDLLEHMVAHGLA